MLVEPELNRLRVGTPGGDDDWSWVHYSGAGTVQLLDEEVDLADLWAEVDELAPN